MKPFAARSALSLPGSHDTLRTLLPNGLLILARRNRSAPVMVLDGMLAVPPRLDPPGRAGLSSLTASLLSRGSRRFSYDAVNEAVESVGATLAIGADNEGVNLGLASLSEDFGALLLVLADALRAPRFESEQFSQVQRRRLVHLQERDQETAAMAALRFYETLYPDHVLGSAISGYAESVRALTRDEVAEFHAAWYGPAGGVIAVSGDMEPEAATRLLTEALGDWSSTAAPAPPLPPLAPWPAGGLVRRAIALPDKVQADLVVGVRAVERLHPDFHALRVANTILGVFGMMGRLGEVVREQQGLAYYADSSLDAGRESGTWSAAAGVAPEAVEQALAAILGEFARLADEALPAADLTDSQDYLTGVVPLTLETNDGIASTLLSMEWLGLGLDYLAGYSARIRAVTPADVQRVAATYLRPEQMVAVVAG